MQKYAESGCDPVSTVAQDGDIRRGHNTFLYDIVCPKTATPFIALTSS